MTNRQSLKARKALRSAAAKKGWETRTARERREIEAADRPTPAMLESIRLHAALSENRHREMWANDIGCWSAHFVLDGVLKSFWSSSAYQPPPSLWQRFKAWLS